MFIMKGPSLYRGMKDGTNMTGKCGKPMHMCDCPSESPMKQKGKKDACYHKVKSRVKVWPSAYASGQLVQCRKAGAANWGTKSKK